MSTEDRPATPSIEMTLGDRTYESFSYFRDGETAIPGQTMVARAKEMSANLGEDDCRYLLEHQDQIPVAMRGKVVFVFPAWWLPDDFSSLAYVFWRDDRWVRSWFWLEDDWFAYGRFLRRK